MIYGDVGTGPHRMKSYGNIMKYLDQLKSNIFIFHKISNYSLKLLFISHIFKALFWVPLFVHRTKIIQHQRSQAAQVSIAGEIQGVSRGVKPLTNKMAGAYGQNHQNPSTKPRTL